MAVFTGTDRFEVRRCLGSGSFGVVFEAFDRERGLRVALKLPHAGSARGLYLFKQEFRSLADVTHPNLATLFELLTDQDRWFFTMELVDGVHFLEYLRASEGMVRGTEPTGDPQPRDGGTCQEDPGALPLLPSPPPDYGRVRLAFKQLVEGLQALHGAGMLHRDLKPSNVLVTREGRVVILDFGLVTDLQDSGPGDGKGAGTPSYMSPEQSQGRPTTVASDWYSVGVLLYQALTGRLPFAGSGRAVLSQKLQLDPLEPRYLVPGTPRDLEDLCMELLRRDPEARPRGLDLLERLQQRPLSGALPEPAPWSHKFDLVGREGELAVLLEGFRRVGEGCTVATLLHGDSGTGKSALTQAFQREVRRRHEGVVVMSGRCYEQETVPFKALDSLVDALSQHLMALPAQQAEALLPQQIAALARLFPVLNQVTLIGERRPPTEIPDAQELRRRAFGALRELLRRMALRAPLVLIIDDLQWGDLDSAALLAELLRAPDPPRFMLLLCYRGEEARSSPVLQELLPGLAGSVSLLQDVELRALPGPVARDLARRLLGPGLADAEEQAEWIARESGGSPFFVLELAQHLRRTGREELQDPERRLDDYIRLRVEVLPEAARKLLLTLAIAGYPLDWETLRQASGVEAASVGLLTSLRTEHLIRMRTSARKRFLETYHDRIRVAVALTAGPDRARAVHLALACTLEEHGSNDAQALTRHFEAAGIPAKAADYALKAAAQAEAALAFDQAVDHYRSAIRLKETADPELPALWRRLGDALANAGRSPEAAQAYLRAAEGARGPERNRLHRRAAEEHLRGGDLEAGLAILERLLALAGARLPGSRTGAIVSVLWNRLRLKLRGLAFQERTADQIRPAELERVDTFWAVAMGLGPVDVLRAADFQTRQLLLTLEAGEPFRVVRALAHETILVAAGGNRALEPTHRLVLRTQALAERIGHPNPRARALMAAGIADSMQGRWRSAATRLELVEQLLKQNCTGMDYELHLAQHNGLLAHLVLGDLTLIRERLPVLLQEAREQGDLVAVTNLRVSLSSILSLARDEPGSARGELQGAIEAWSRRDFHLQHYHHLVSRVNLELYDGSFQEAFRVLQEAEEGLEHSLLLKLQPIFITVQELRARAALALALRGPDAALHRIAQQQVRRLEAERTAYGGALALKLRGLLAFLGGRREEGLALFLRSERTFEACDMGLHVMALRYMRGKLQGRRDLLDEARSWMEGQGIQNPARFAAMHVPLPD